MSARQNAPAWVVLRWKEGAESHGKAAWYLGPSMLGTPSFTKDREAAQTMPQAEAERMAEDWNSYAATKGSPETYRAEPAEKDAQQ